MKSNLLKMFVLLLSAASMTACSKSGGDKKSNVELLTKAAWKYQIAGLDSDKNGTVDMESQDIEDCNKDDLATFATGGTGTIDEGATKCDAGDPQSYSFTWQFKNNETELEYDGEVYKVLSIDDSNLKVYYDYDFGGTTFRFLLIFKH
jgi:hypothetical protein